MLLFARDENVFNNGQDGMPDMSSMEFAKSLVTHVTILRTN